MQKVKDYAGQRYEFLTAIKAAGRNKHNNILWEFKCECGGTKTVIPSQVLSSHHHKDCGCRTAPRKNHVIKNPSFRHKEPQAYDTLQGIRERCLNPNANEFKRYGGRGVKVCARWLGHDGFENFHTDMGPRPSVQHSVDRQDNDGDYTPDNCRWATRTEQARNTRVVKANKSGIMGVWWRKNKQRWDVSCYGNYIGINKDFFEACCMRKSAEVRYGSA